MVQWLDSTLLKWFELKGFVVNSEKKTVFDSKYQLLIAGLSDEDWKDRFTLLSACHRIRNKLAKLLND